MAPPLRPPTGSVAALCGSPAGWSKCPRSSPSCPPSSSSSRPPARPWHPPGPTASGSLGSLHSPAWEGSREQAAGIREQGAGSREQGAGSRKQGAGDLIASIKEFQYTVRPYITSPPSDQDGARHGLFLEWRDGGQPTCASSMQCQLPILNVAYHTSFAACSRHYQEVTDVSNPSTAVPDRRRTTGGPINCFRMSLCEPLAFWHILPLAIEWQSVLRTLSRTVWRQQCHLDQYLLSLDGVGPVDKRPSTD